MADKESKPDTMNSPEPEPHIQPAAEKDREDEIVYTKETSTAWDQTGKSQSDEDGEVISRPWYRRCLRHWKHVVYAVIWLLFTG